MELPFNYFPYLGYITDNPVMLVIWAAFGTPVLIFLLILITKFYKNGSLGEKISVILLTSFGFTWIVGFLIMIILLFTGVSGIKMYFIWLLLLISSLIFTIMNFNLIFKNYDKAIQNLKDIKK